MMVTCLASEFPMLLSLRVCWKSQHWNPPCFLWRPFQLLQWRMSSREVPSYSRRDFTSVSRSTDITKRIALELYKKLFLFLPFLWKLINIFNCIRLVMFLIFAFAFACSKVVLEKTDPSWNSHNMRAKKWKHWRQLWRRYWFHWDTALYDSLERK